MSESSPESLIDDLALRFLHGMADEDSRKDLARLLVNSQGNRRRFLDHVLLHGMLARAAHGGVLADNLNDFFENLEERVSIKKTNRRLGFWLPAAAAVIAALVATVLLMPGNAVAALNRVIDAMKEAGDRTYKIEVISAGSDAETLRTDRGRFPPSNHLDGATLWLRGSGEFVLSQSLPNGETRVIGRNGTQSWSIRGAGPVRISRDPDRFGRAIFARNGDVAFLDLRTQLDRLRYLYRIEWLDQSSEKTWKLLGHRHSHEKGGPREIELWFNPDTGLIERLILRHLPRGNGGPQSIAIILGSTVSLPPDFFQHTRHHEPGRTIVEEP